MATTDQTPSPEEGVIPIVPMVPIVPVEPLKFDQVIQVPRKFECSRCGVSYQGKEVRHLCVTCIKINQSELDGLRTKIKNMEMELLQANNSLNTNEVLRVELSRSNTAMEQAAQEDGMEKLRVKADKFRLTDSVRAWRLYRDHVKAMQKCIPCKTGLHCPELESLEKNAESQTPNIACHECVERDKAILMHKAVTEEYKRFHHHERSCPQCSSVSKGRCWDGGDIMGSFKTRIESVGREHYGQMLFNRLRESVSDFSNFGESSAIIYQGSRYKMIKIDLKRVPLDATQYLSEGTSPGMALDRAKKHLLSLNVHSST